jgi:hypothetical protein
MPITISTPWGDRRERKEMEGFAKLNGLQFSEADAFGLSMLPFSVLRGGDTNGCRNVVYGTWKEINVWAFVAWQTDRDLDGTDSSEYYTCAAAPVPADCPQVEIHSTNALTRALSKVGMGTAPVAFESADFNRAFRVTASESKFAFDVVDAGMMQWLLAKGQGWHFGISGRYALMYRNRKRHDSEQTGTVLDQMVGFYRHIPDVVASLYPLNQPKMSPQLAVDMAKARAAGFDPVEPGTATAPTVAAVTLGGGVPGRMTIVAVQETGVSMAGGRLVQLEADVTPQGGQAYRMTQPVVVTPEHADRIAPGASLAVRVDSATSALLGVDWDAS